MTPPTFEIPWPLRHLPTLGFSVGPCAWRISMLAQGFADVVERHPSLLVAGPDDDDALLQAAAKHIGVLPVMLMVREPEFARELPKLIEGKMQAMGRRRVEVLTLLHDDALELKGGLALQTLFDWRNRGAAGHIGLANADVRQAEWLAAKTAGRVLVLPYSLQDQSARFRAIPKAEEFGFTPVALNVTEAGSDAGSLAALRFALGDSQRVLPVLDKPIPSGLMPMSEAEVEEHWREYQKTHEPPKELGPTGPVE